MITIKQPKEQSHVLDSPLHRRVDLHAHSTFSDGALTPTALLTLAKEQNVELFSLTDHDTIAGLSEAKIAANELGISLLTGVEISTQWQGIPLHMVALNFSESEASLLDVLASNQSIRLERAKRIATLLQKQGLPDLYDAATAEAGASQIGRPHFAKVMVQFGLVKDANKAFDQYLGNKRLGQLRDVWPEIEVLLPMLKGKGMELVLAHPKRYPITATKLRRLVGQFSAWGGTAIEVSSGNEKPENVRFLERLTREHNIKASVGSDYHGPYGPWSQVGKYTPIDEAGVSTVWQSW